MDNNITVPVSSNTQRQPMTVVAAPSNVVLQGSSDIYVIKSINALRDNTDAIITLSEADKKTLDKLFTDGTETAVIVEGGGNLSVRYQFVSSFLLIVFLVSNGQGQTYIVGYQYSYNVCRCIIKYKLADIGENETMLTADNWQQYITLPSGGGNEWIETTDMYDTNLYNAKELCIEVELWGQYSMVYMCFPDTLGAHSANSFEFVIPFASHTSNTFTIVYDGSALIISFFSSYRIFYRL